jgi:hypothetical protein
MMYNTQNDLVFGLFPLPGILKKKIEKKRFGNWVCSCPQASGETPTLLGTSERANFNH